MTDLEVKVKEHFELRNLTGQTVVVALSGGVDSVVLLDVLSRLVVSLDLKVEAAHVNHHMHSKSDEWANFCSSLCADYSIPLRIFKAQVPKRSSLGIEGAARQARFDALLSHDSSIILLAHHQDDQIETFFLQALRGSGVDGLSGMLAVRKDHRTHKTIFRPMLGVKREEIVAYAKYRGLSWVEDPSNSDRFFSRNYLRKETLPQLSARFPFYEESILNVVKNLGDVSDVLKEVAAQDIDLLRSSCGGIDIDGMNNMSEVRAINMFRELFRARGLAVPGRSWMTEVLRQCKNAQISATVSVDKKNISIKRYRNHVYLVEKNEEVIKGWSRGWDNEMLIDLPGNLGHLEFKQVVGAGIPARFVANYALTIQLGAGNKRFSLAHNRPRRELRKIWQTHGIPPWLRSNIPVVFTGSDALFVGGLGISGHCRVQKDELGISIIWRSNV
ncbi:tRNA lysidine(34) synthetase TilS [Burkholderiales bacterium]|nr:tRNA lysidine(34) synthetase TilS [Burkholderiales bacterium]